MSRARGQGEVRTKRVAMAGAGGLIGSVVARDLTTNGNEVVSLVRHEPGAGEVRWDPDGGTIDRGGLCAADARRRISAELAVRESAIAA